MALKGKILSKSFIPSEATDPPVNGFIFGPTGAGKTQFLCSASEILEPHEILLMTTDRHDETIQRFKGKLQVLDLVGILDEDLRPAELVLDDLCKELNQVLTIRMLQLDSISKLRNWLLRKEVKRQYELDLKLVEAKKKAPTAVHDPNVPEQRDYMVVGEILADFVVKLRNLAFKRKFHLLMTAYEKDDDIEITTGTWATQYHMDLNPEMLRVISYEVGFVARMTATMTNKTVVVKGGETNGQEEGQVKNNTTGPTSNSKVGLRVGAGVRRPILSAVKTERTMSRKLVFLSSDAATKNRLGLPSEIDSPTMKDLFKNRSIKFGDMQRQTSDSAQSETEVESTETETETKTVTEP